ncbi:MAG TPA: hypothetical protein VEH05_16790, partial [Streptosporangiaceae bacterium]|nr:hypothetical protein [Streptosporangiaceae bacterium]
MAGAVWSTVRRGICLHRRQQLSGGGFSHATTAVRCSHAAVGQISRAIQEHLEDEHLEGDVPLDVAQHVAADVAQNGRRQRRAGPAL